MSRLRKLKTSISSVIAWLCIAGTEEESGACLELPERPPIDVRRLPGSHHFKGDYAGLGDAVARFIETTMVTRERNRQ